MKTLSPMTQTRDFHGIICSSKGSSLMPSACMFCPLLMPTDANEPSTMPTGPPQDGSALHESPDELVSAAGGVAFTDVCACAA